MTLSCYLLDDANVNIQFIICMGAHRHRQGGHLEMLKNVAVH